MSAGAMTKEIMRQTVERMLREARSAGRDLSPSELHALLRNDHAEIAAMDLPRFSGGIVRPVKQRLNSEARDERIVQAVQASLLGGDLEAAKDRMRRLLLHFGYQCAHPESAQERVLNLGRIEHYVQEFFHGLSTDDRGGEG